MKFKLWFKTLKEINDEEIERLDKFDKDTDIIDESEYDNRVYNIVSNICEMIGKLKAETYSDTALYNGEQRYYYVIEPEATLTLIELSGEDNTIGIIEGAQQEYDIIYDYEVLEA